MSLSTHEQEPALPYCKGSDECSVSFMHQVDEQEQETIASLSTSKIHEIAHRPSTKVQLYALNEASIHLSTPTSSYKHSHNPLKLFHIPCDLCSKAYILNDTFNFLALIIFR